MSAIDYTSKFSPWSADVRIWQVSDLFSRVHPDWDYPWSLSRPKQTSWIDST